MSDTAMRTAEEWFSIQNGRTYAGDADYVAAIKEIQEDAVEAARDEYGVTPVQCMAGRNLARRWMRYSPGDCGCHIMPSHAIPCGVCLARLALGLSDGKDAAE